MDIGILREKLEENKEHKVKAICYVHNEISSGLERNLENIRKVLSEYDHRC